MIKKMIRNFFSAFGLEVKRKNVLEVLNDEQSFQGYDYGLEAKDAIRIVQGNTMMAPLNLLTLFEQAVYCEKMNIEGAYVECGVWKGGAVGIMAKANLQFGKARRPLHLFDAFDDICAPEAEVDGVQAINDMKKYTSLQDKREMKGQLEAVKGAYDFLGGHGTIDACKNLLEKDLEYPAEMIHYHKGWFQDTLPQESKEIDKIAILRLDGDWYASIKICLDYLYDKVIPGGLIVIDDYGYYEGCTKAVDEFLDSRGIKTFLSYAIVGSRYFVKR
jgi:hypothetical protein